MQKLEDGIMQLVHNYGTACCDQTVSYMQDDWHAGEDAEMVIHLLLAQIRGKIHDLVLQVDHSDLVVEAAKEKIEELSKAEVQAEPVAADLIETVDTWFAKNTGLGGCSDKDVAELAAIFTSRQATQQDAIDAETIKKAQRYDWLRHGDNDERIIMRGPVSHDFVYLPRNEKLDEIIDTAIQAAKQGV